MCIGGPKLLRQGRAKAAPRPRQGRAKARHGKNGLPTPKKTPPELILELLETNFAAPVPILYSILFNVCFLTDFVTILDEIVIDL